MLQKLLGLPRFIRQTITLCYLLLISFLTLLPQQDLPQVPLFPMEDKIIHFLMHFGLGFLIRWIINDSKQLTRKKFLAYTLAFGWGIVLECCQYLMHAGRQFSVLDMSANILGVIAGFLIFIQIDKLSKKKK